MKTTERTGNLNITRLLFEENFRVSRKSASRGFFEGETKSNLNQRIGTI